MPYQRGPGYCHRLELPFRQIRAFFNPDRAKGKIFLFINHGLKAMAIKSISVLHFNNFLNSAITIKKSYIG